MADIPNIPDINWNREGIFDSEVDGPELVRLFENQTFRRVLGEIQAVAVLKDTLQGLDLATEAGRLAALQRQSSIAGLNEAVGIVQGLLTDNNLAEVIENDE